MQALEAEILAILRGSTGSKSPQAECERILFYVLRETRADIHELSDLRRLTIQPSSCERDRILTIARARAAGKPLQHLLGWQFFYSHDYRVDASTLIPRPETEVLIDSAIRWAETRFGDRPFLFAELGLGSGILSGELLARFPSSRGSASEVSRNALTLARNNLGRIVGSDFEARLRMIEALPGTGFESLIPHGPFDLVISNPPYVAPTDEIDPETLEHEPGSALFPAASEGGTADPSFFYSDLIRHSGLLLRPGGMVFIEIPHERSVLIQDLFLQSGLQNVKLIADLTGRPRVLSACAPGTET